MKRFTDTDIWDKPWFMELSPKHKCLIKFIFDKCDASGVWIPNWILASTYIGEKVSEKDISAISNQVEKIGPEKFFVHSFIFFQYGELSENCKPHKKIFQLIEKHNLKERLSKGYKRVFDTQQEEEEEKEEYKEEEKEEEEAEIIFPFSLEFTPVWNSWKDYKKEEHRERYKSKKTEQAALNKLYNLSQGDEEIAYKIIEESISNQWKGLFELKNNGKQQTNKTTEHTTGDRLVENYLRRKFSTSGRD